MSKDYFPSTIRGMQFNAGRQGKRNTWHSDIVGRDIIRCLVKNRELTEKLKIKKKTKKSN